METKFSCSLKAFLIPSHLIFVYIIVSAETPLFKILTKGQPGQSKSLTSGKTLSLIGLSSKEILKFS